MRSTQMVRLSLAATGAALLLTAIPFTLASANAAPAGAVAAAAVSPRFIPPATFPEPEPEPTVAPEPEPEPTVAPEPEPTVDPEPVPEPTVDPEPVPVPEPVPLPVEPVPPVEEPTDDGGFVDDGDDFDDSDFAPVVPAPAPVETPTPTPTPSATPIPAVDIFAPFYPPSSGPVRDLMPLILGGAAAALMMLAAVASFIVSRFRLARMRSMTAVTLRPAGSSASIAPRASGKTPSNLDISALVGAAAPPAPLPAERLLAWSAGPRVANTATTSAASLELGLPKRSTRPTGARREAIDFAVPSLGERPAPAREPRKAVSKARFKLAGLLAPPAPKAPTPTFEVDAFGVRKPRPASGGGSPLFELPTSLRRPLPTIR